MKKKCTRCHWHNNEFVNCTGYFGAEKSDLAFLGEAFGRSEALAGEAFVGDAGKKLIALLDIIGLSRDDVSILNSMRCYQVGNPTPSKKEMDTCLPYTFFDIQKINPKLVIALGASAFYQATGKDDFAFNRGKLLWSERLKRKVFTTYHPASVLYDKNRWDTLVSDFTKIPYLIDADPDDIKHYSYKVISTIEEFNEIKPNLFKVNDIFFDLETTGLDVFRDRITTIQLYTGIEPAYILLPSIYEDIKEDLKYIFENKNIIGQGFEFDAKVLYNKFGIMINKWKFDSCLAEYLLTGMRDNNLDFLVGKYVPDSYGYSDDVKEVGGAHLVKDDNILYQYGANDVGVLKPIRKKQLKQLEKENTLWLLENITIPCNKVLTKMSLRGVKYDLDQLWKTDDKYRILGEKALSKALSLKKVKAVEEHFKQPFNPRSSLHVRYLLIDLYHLPVIKTSSKTKIASVDKKTMKIYADKYNNAYCKEMEMYRSYQSIRDNFLSGVVPKLYGDIAHTSYSLHATTTGRPNSRDPNLLNIPRNDEDIKSIYIARPGHIFLYSDLSQIEVRIAAVVYNDENLIELCNTKGKDFHCMITAKVYNLPYDEVFQKYKSGDKEMTEKRSICKSITFGILYGKTPEGLAKDMQVSVDEAKGFIDDYFSGFPQLYDNIEKLKRHVIKTGYVDTYFKFRRRWRFHSEEDHKTLREATNHGIQGTAWNLMQLILIKVDEYLESFQSGLIMQVYDSLGVEALEEEIDEIAPNIKYLMETINQPFEGLNRVNIKADMEIGKKLSKMKKMSL